MENETQTYEITLITYRPYTQVITVEASDMDDAIDQSFENIDYNKFAPVGELDNGYEVEVYEVTPNDELDDEEGDTEESD